MFKIVNNQKLEWDGKNWVDNSSKTYKSYGTAYRSFYTVNRNQPEQKALILNCTTGALTK